MADSDFKIVRKYYPDEDKFQLVKHKGTYPYDKASDSTYLNRIGLPPREDYYSILKRKELSQKKYEHEEKVFKTFKYTHFKQQHDLYCFRDVIILADCFEKFRSICLEKDNYGLDPCYYYSTPGLTWDCGLKYTKVKLELLTDYNMVMFTEKSKRGGLSGVMGTRHVKANNKYLDNYDPNKESNFLSYFDANNLYGLSMSQPLPYGGFEWLDDQTIYNYNSNIQQATKDILALPDDSTKGYFYQVDLTYTDYIKERTKNLPLAPIKRKIETDELSNYQQFLIRDNKTNMMKRTPIEKLISNQNNKEGYVLHYRNLKFYLKEGMEITKIHKMLQFNQSPWLKSYIDFNTIQRNKGKTTFEKNFFKLMNNSFYGKTVENIRNRIELHLINNDEDKVIRYQSKPNFLNTVSFTDNLKAVKMRKKTCLFNKPIYVGISVLEHSKLYMYEFYYDVLKKRYPFYGELELVGMDTDSFFLNIKTADLWVDIKNDLELYKHFDFSNTPKDHPLYNPNNKKLGMFKNELAAEKNVKNVNL